MKMDKCGTNQSEFPVWALLPRKETGVVNLLAKYPTYDGRGTVIAIFDSGVDPAAPGLQVTTDGKVKVIDRIDASGAGDVDTTVVVEAEDGAIKGLTNRTLQIPASWNNPSGKFHVGVKSAYHLYSRRLQDRIVRERREKLWNGDHKSKLAEAQAESQKVSEKSKDTNDLSFFDKLAKENAEAKVTILNNLEKKYKDVGPAYDVVAFLDDKDIWRVCIDTSECGELEKGILLGEYIKTQEHAFLTPSDQYTVSVNVYNDGNRVEIVGACTSHGTHVASIAAAHFPDCPERNGVAPGAQIVSITIGDNRIDSMETMTAISRAMCRVMTNPHYKVDVINMSYGEFGHSFKFGRFGDLANEVVNKYGVIWIASASNSGPALCTIGIPPDMKNDSIVGVGAYVSSEMMTAEYSMVEKLPGCPYTWSSRGPTMDGARGVSICAPGGAITSVPCFTLRKNQLMNGTSMSAPHTTGAFALLVSGLKDKKIKYSPYSVRRSVENTALHLNNTEEFAQGHGLLQVDKAFEHLCKFNGGVEDMIRFNVECGNGGCKGIHLRNWDADRIMEFFCDVEPIILDELSADPKDKLAFDMELIFTCDAPWVKYPQCLQMSYITRNFKIVVDPAGLEAGQIYTTSVKAFLAKNPDRGHLFEVPITVIVPIKELVNGHQFVSSSFLHKPGSIRRTFIKVPMDATWATINIKAKNCEKVLKLALQCVQIKPFSKISTLDYFRMVDLQPGDPASYTFCVRGGFTLEVCLARWWACLYDGEVDFTVDFHGIVPNNEIVSFVSGDQYHRQDVRVAFKTEELLPQAVLKHFAQVCPPNENKIQVLEGHRDTVPPNRPIYQLILTYNFQVAKSGLEVAPKFNLLNDVLYESPFDSQLYMIFDSNKQYLYSGDAYYDKYSTKLDKGDYVLKLHVRHEKVALLESLTECPLTLVIKLPQEVKLDIYQSHCAASTSGKKIGTLNIAKGRSLPLFITSPNLTDKSLKGIGLSVGNTLQGTIVYSKDDQVRKADVYQLKVFVSDYICKKKNNNDEKKDDKPFKDYLDAKRDLQASFIGKLDKDSREKLFNEINEDEETSKYNPLRLARAQSCFNDGNDAAVIKLVDEVISSIDSTQLLAFYGTKADNRPNYNKIKVDNDKQKAWLLEALNKKGLSLLREEPAGDKLSREEEITKIATEILKFVDPSDKAVVNFFIKFYLHHGYSGIACKLVTKLCEDKYTKENEEKLLETYESLGWKHVINHVKKASPTRFPKTYVLF